ncbi:diacylglycerol kinase [Inhella gelatinilytica]|uniref:Diacylglycerol kinase n=1 Tax=Inhella gelatinilytica TaxID=2795030 RepID=A0A931IWE8_9BURK|nr:diacylglycerol kinase [Inhella gelatinilytica]MBH9552284.1 diacylglycerol kinase [Inhella gelatinilytica]
MTPSQHPLKSHGGLIRVWRAFGYSLQGLRAAVQHEAAFRQELVIGIPLIAAAPWLGRSLGEVLALIGAVVLVWMVELLNSALEALADAISVEHHALLGRAKDFGSAAVLMALLLCTGVWGWVIVERWA